MLFMFFRVLSILIIHMNADHPNLYMKEPHSDLGFVSDRITFSSKISFLLMVCFSLMSVDVIVRYCCVTSRPPAKLRGLNRMYCFFLLESW